MILPAGSNAVQFEVKRNCSGSRLLHLPVVIWVDRWPHDISYDKVWCENNAKAFEVLHAPVDWKPIAPGGDGVKVCACMGDFVE